MENNFIIIDIDYINMDGKFNDVEKRYNIEINQKLRQQLKYKIIEHYLINLKYNSLFVLKRKNFKYLPDKTIIKFVVEFLKNNN